MAGAASSQRCSEALTMEAGQPICIARNRCRDCTVHTGASLGTSRIGRTLPASTAHR